MKSITVKCLLCNQIIHSYSDDTSSLIEHLKIMHPEVKLKSLKSSINEINRISDSPQNENAIEHYDNDSIQEGEPIADETNRNSLSKRPEHSNINFSVPENNNGQKYRYIDDDSDVKYKYVDDNEYDQNSKGTLCRCPNNMNNFPILSRSDHIKSYMMDSSYCEKMRAKYNNENKRNERQSTVVVNEIRNKDYSIIDKYTQTDDIKVSRHDSNSIGKSHRHTKKTSSKDSFKKRSKDLFRKRSKDLFRKRSKESLRSKMSLKRKAKNTKNNIERKHKCKKKMYKTSIEKWRPGKDQISCPCCGKLGIPVIRNRTDRITSSPIGAACILSCWPFCFLPFSYKPNIKEYLYCSTCYYFLGVYDHKTSVIHPNLAVMEKNGSPHGLDSKSSLLDNALSPEK